nr:exocyst complex component sec3 [Quercus suber]
MSRQGPPANGNNGYRNMSNGSTPSFARNAAPPYSQRTDTLSGNNNLAAASRAEKFEDEKRRIIESCFSKTDANSQLSESYITHIRITEDAAYPSSPPPPDSPTTSKKPRLIIIAVRSTGRVRMHKARENNNGSFSIGKTWNMEELSAIESFSATSLVAQSDLEAQQRQWAGPTGFTVTILKQYYWQAGTPKEKDFFIASAIKIYNKYTKGQVPELIGFDEKEKAAMLSQLPGQRPAPQGAPAPRRPSDMARGSPGSPQPPFATRESHSRYGSPGPPGSIPPASRQQSGTASPARFNGLNPPPGPRSFASQEQMRSHSGDGGRADHRPGTSPGPMLGASRSPPAQMPYPVPSERSSHSNMRSGSPATSAVSSERDTGPPPMRSSSPPRHPAPHQASLLGERQQEDSYAQQNQITTGANISKATQQRWVNQDMSSAQQSELPSRDQFSGGAPQLPPIKTAQLLHPVSSQNANGAPQTSASEESSGIDPGDAQTIGALTAYWRNDTATGTAPAPTPPLVAQVVSPPTPERSRKRPSVDRGHSDVDPALRPPPLMGRNKTPLSEQHRGMSDVNPTGREQPTETQPRAVVNRTASPVSEKVANIPGAFDPPPLGATPEPPQDVNKEDREQNDTQPEAEPESQSEVDQAYRPGLGPMIKKNNVRNKMKAAAAAAQAFKPRPGGAAEKILKAKAEREGNVEPDGITAVVPRPSRQNTAEVPSKVDPPEDDSLKKSATIDALRNSITVPPLVQVSSPLSPENRTETPTLDGASGIQLTDEPVDAHLKVEQSEELQTQPEAEGDRLEQREVRKLATKVKRRSGAQDKYLTELGIERALLENKCLDFEAALIEHGWTARVLQPKHLADIEAGLKREQGRLEAGNWLSHTDATRDEKVVQVETLLDKAIQECDELEGLLTLYNVELGSLNEDIAYIEAQSQGLQVQSANQKLLLNELQSLVDTMSLDRKVLEPLRHGNLDTTQGVHDVERSLMRLYRAMITMDPQVRAHDSNQSRHRGVIANGGSDLSSMKALREKSDTYGRESNAFCQRLLQHMDLMFTAALNDAKPRVLRPMSAGPGQNSAVRLQKEAFAEAKRPIWVYSPLVLFMKEINPQAWQTVLRLYGSRSQPFYADSFKQNIASWKRSARKPGPEDGEMLFTTLEKEDVAPTSGGSIAGNSLAAARKLTVKRSQTLAKTLRNAGTGSKNSATTTRAPGMSLMSSEVFAGLMDDMAPLVSQEQNFVVDMFHATSLESLDFLDAVTATHPDGRRGTNLLDRKPIDPDRQMGKYVQTAMEEIFNSCFAAEMGSLLEWSVSNDPIQGVGVMAALTKHAYYLQDTNQEFLLQLMETLTTRLQKLWTKFVEEQVHAIEDTKVKIKKRKGVIAFMKVFPHFSSGVENVFSAVAGMDYEGPAECVADVRQLVDDTYQRLNRAMFDSLKVIAKESPGAATSTALGTAAQKVGGADESEDKEMLNHYILLIENMNHYIEEVDDGGKEGVLAEWRGRAMLERMEALDAYVNRVLRRPLGKFLDFLDSTESLLTSHPTNPQAVSQRPSYSRKVARTLFAQYDGKEVRRGIDTLRKRIEKHFGDGDEEQLSRGLVAFVCKQCERGYERALERTERIIREIYPPMEGEKNVELPFEKADIAGGFRR